MKKQPGIETDLNHAVVKVLSVSPIEDDHVSLERSAGQSGKAMHTDSRWAVQRSSTLDSALLHLRESRIPVVVCERDLSPGTWLDILEEVLLMPYSPCLIVTSRLADNRLWAEALNLGAWDVMAKPFEHAEVIRILSAAWRHWNDQHGVPVRSVNVMKAAS